MNYYQIYTREFKEDEIAISTIGGQKIDTTPRFFETESDLNDVKLGEQGIVAIKFDEVPPVDPYGNKIVVQELKGIAVK